MSTIRFTFEDLCAFFTSNPSRLMVGLISTEGEAPENVHAPHIVIKQNGMIEREYAGFAEINGDISLDVYPEGPPINHHTPASKHDPRKSFNLLVDIEKNLYGKEMLNVNPMLCSARLHFVNGELYTAHPFANVGFADLKTKEPCAYSPSVTATSVGLDVDIPAGGCAVLHFRGETEDFVFEDGPDYEVEVANRADAIAFDHFRYFYSIVDPKPDYMWVPISGDRIGTPVPMASPEVYCMPGGFGATVFDWLLLLIGLKGEPPSHS